MSNIFTDFSSVISRWRIWFLMTNQDLTLRYRRSMIGPFWISLSMLATVFGLGFLYTVIFKQEYREYVSYLAAGLMAWGLINGLIASGCSSVVSAEHHIRSVSLSMPFLAAKTTYLEAILFFHNFLAALAVIFILRGPPNAEIFMFPPALALVLGVGFFWAIIAGALSARFRDIPQIVTNIMQFLFFMTPIFWKPEFVADRPALTLANPFYHLLEILRAPLLGQRASEENWAVALAILAGTALAAILMDAYARKRFFLWL